MFEFRGWAAVAGLLFALGVFGPSIPEADHHEHPGVTDAHPDDVAHHHGDADDHHDSPDSPCHHHVIHCDCTAGLVCLPVEEFGSELQSASVGAPTPVRLAIPPSASAIFHVPIA